jgi:hypothetical protein
MNALHENPHSHSQLGPVIYGQDGRQEGAQGLIFWPRQAACRQCQGPREPILANHGRRTGGDPGVNDGFDRNGDLQAARASDAGALIDGINQSNQED